MSDLIDLIYRNQAIDAVSRGCKELRGIFADCEKNLNELPAAEPEIVRCKDCKHQEKYFHTDRRRKDGGYYIYGCELAEEYSHVCLDDDFCSRAERRTDERP